MTTIDSPVKPANDTVIGCLWVRNRPGVTLGVNSYPKKAPPFSDVELWQYITGSIVGYNGVMEYKTMTHPWGAVYDENSEVLILGTFPSPKSREMGFYYGHPQNIFWKTLADILKQPEPPATVAARKAFLLHNHIAVWDVLASCEIEGASDMSIRNPVPNKFRPILAQTKIRKIFTTGKKATQLFEKYCAQEAGMPSVYLPSTSPANRAQQAKPEFHELWQLGISGRY